ncbi:hypothetical protein L0M16_17880 [Mycolicibacterium sp. YH-1]|nr:hypothetical protein [Mycolicibacterium sp. YH-1]UNB49888.1 hypothetical protein L0M16_17880 [Mycolicibacterium sp. YH-1]
MRAIERLDRHVRATTAIGPDPRDAALIQGAADHRFQQTHAFDDLAPRPAKVDRLSARVGCPASFRRR